LQKNADEREVQESAEEKNLKPELTAQFVIPELARDDFPETYKFLDNVAQTSRVITTKFKDHFATKRPYISDKRVKALIDAHDNPAYPSGHTSGAYITAHALSLIFPNTKEEFFNRAEEIAQHRVLVGMHFPHDIQGGKQLAVIMSQKLASNEGFLRDLKAAQEEIANKSN
jgi:acid phosphatase (class A)